MSWEHAETVYKHSKAKGSARAVFAYLAHRMNEDGECWPSRETIASELGIAVKTVGNALKKLSEIGEISVSRRQYFNVYTFQIGSICPSGSIQIGKLGHSDRQICPQIGKLGHSDRQILPTNSKEQSLKSKKNNTHTPKALPIPESEIIDIEPSLSPSPRHQREQEIGAAFSKLEREEPEFVKETKRVVHNSGAPNYKENIVMFKKKFPSVTAEILRTWEREIWRNGWQFKKGQKKPHSGHLLSEFKMPPTEVEQGFYDSVMSWLSGRVRYSELPFELKQKIKGTSADRRRVGLRESETPKLIQEILNYEPASL